MGSRTRTLLCAGGRLGIAAALWPGHALAAEAIRVARVATFSLMFSLLFRMLGPIKILGPFVAMTQGADPARRCHRTRPA